MNNTQLTKTYREIVETKQSESQYEWLMFNLIEDMKTEIESLEQENDSLSDAIEDREDQIKDLEADLEKAKREADQWKTMYDICNDND